MMKRTVLDLKIGEKAKIISYFSQNIPTRICEMALLPGTTLEMKSKSLRGSTCFIYCGDNNSKIALRKAEAKFLLIEKL
jgi:ferrous iron transport protein A